MLPNLGQVSPSNEGDSDYSSANLYRLKRRSCFPDVDSSLPVLHRTNVICPFLWLSPVSALPVCFLYLFDELLMSLCPSFWLHGTGVRTCVTRESPHVSTLPEQQANYWWLMCLLREMSKFSVGVGVWKRRSGLKDVSWLPWSSDTVSLSFSSPEGCQKLRLLTEDWAAAERTDEVQ